MIKPRNRFSAYSPRLGLVLLLTAFCSSALDAALVSQPVDWATGSSGSIGAITVTLSNISNASITTAGSFASSSYSAAPHPFGTEAIDFAASSDWTAGFSQPIDGLLLYVRVWRGERSTLFDPPTDYTFSQPFTILSGLQNVSVNGNTITMPDGNFYSGIVQFIGTTSSVSVDAVYAGTIGVNSLQTLTFAQPIPEPTTALFGLALAGFCTAARRRLRLTA